MRTLCSASYDAFQRLLLNAFLLSLPCGMRLPTRLAMPRSAARKRLEELL